VEIVGNLFHYINKTDASPPEKILSGRVGGGKCLPGKEEREGQVDGYARAQVGWGRERGRAFDRVVMLRYVEVGAG
jgi:hypothetical protein